MAGKNGTISRRTFIKNAGAAGLGTALLMGDAPPAVANLATKLPEGETVPTRPFGNTGAQVSILSLGGVLNMSDQLMFRQAIKKGVTYWDTADSYGWGKNEKAIGKYFNKYPEDRKKVFLVTKAASTDPEKLTEKLEASLQKMSTTYVDLYMIHHVSNADDELTDGVKKWAQKAKADGKIRLFGFSAHKNMQKAMHAAAKLGWIDGIMMSYNYRLMVMPDMQKAVDACVKAGIGLTAMKTQAAFSANLYSSIGSESDDALKMTEKFLSKGFTAEQAKLMAVWENPHIASICSAMSTMTILQANIAAALNKKSLSAGDKQRLGKFASLTGAGYCAGCTQICESVIDLDIPVGDILRYSMYHHGYGDWGRAHRLFKALPAEVKDNLLEADYSKAELRCPQKIRIGETVAAAYQALA